MHHYGASQMGTKIKPGRAPFPPILTTGIIWSQVTKSFVSLCGHKLLSIIVFFVTNIFPDGKISRPRLAVFSFASQNKNIAPASKSTKCYYIFNLAF